MKVLDVGSGAKSMAKYNFEEAEIVRCDIDPDLEPDLLHDLREPFPDDHQGVYDVVFASHVLEHMSKMQVIPVVQNMMGALKEGGELWLIVPDCQFAAELIMDQEDIGVVAMGLLWGGQVNEDGSDNEHQYHKVGFTTLGMRKLFAEVGLIARQVYRTPFTIRLNNEHDLKALQIVAIGAKVSKT